MTTLFPNRGAGQRDRLLSQLVGRLIQTFLFDKMLQMAVITNAKVDVESPSARVMTRSVLLVPKIWQEVVLLS